MSRHRSCTFVIALTILTSACATSGGTPRPFPTPRPPAPASTPSPPPAPSTPAAMIGSPSPPAPVPTSGGRTAVAYGITGTALTLRGAPYRNGGADPSGFDCSGFVQYVFEQNGVRVPRTVTEQFRAGRDVETPSMEPGDLVFFTTVTPGASHVGISIGGDEFVHAPSGYGEVRVERLSAPYWSTRFVGVKRVL
jgi:cell wall-associated NlpC family hydrolase